MTTYKNRQKLTKIILERLKQYGYYWDGMTPQKHYAYAAAIKIITIRLFGNEKTARELKVVELEKAIAILNEILPEKNEERDVGNDYCVDNNNNNSYYSGY